MEEEKQIYKFCGSDLTNGNLQIARVNVA